MTPGLWTARQLLLALGLWLLSGVLLWAVFWSWPLDAWSIAPYVGQAGQWFPWREHPALAVLSHVWVKRVAIATGLLAGLGALAGWRNPRWRDWCWPGGFVVAAMLLSPGVVGLFKRFSHHSCPWDLQVYGGRAAEFALFAAVPEQAGAGRCFPGGHAASGFALLAFFWVARSARLPRAGWYAAAALLIGLAMGWAQVIRGAHFWSHNLWTLWWTVGVQAALWVLMSHWAARSGATLAAPPGMLSGFRLRGRS